MLTLYCIHRSIRAADATRRLDRLDTFVLANVSAPATHSPLNSRLEETSVQRDDNASAEHETQDHGDGPREIQQNQPEDEIHGPEVLRGDGLACNVEWLSDYG